MWPYSSLKMVNSLETKNYHFFLIFSFLFMILHHSNALRRAFEWRTRIGLRCFSLLRFLIIKSITGDLLIFEKLLTCDWYPVRPSGPIEVLRSRGHLSSPRVSPAWFSNAPWIPTMMCSKEAQRISRYHANMRRFHWGPQISRTSVEPSNFTRMILKCSLNPDNDVQ